MAHFPYSVQEEPLFVIYHIDNILSVTGANMLHSFKEVSYFHVWSNSFTLSFKKKTVLKDKSFVQPKKGTNRWLPREASHEMMLAKTAINRYNVDVFDFIHVSSLDLCWSKRWLTALLSYLYFFFF